MSSVVRPARLLDPGLCLTLRPMAYPAFFEMYRAAIKNTWTVEEVDFSTDVGDLRNKMTAAERQKLDVTVKAVKEKIAEGLAILAAPPAPPA